MKERSQMPRIHAVILVPDVDPTLADPLEIVDNMRDAYEEEGYEYINLVVESAEWEK